MNGEKADPVNLGVPAAPSAGVGASPVHTPDVGIVARLRVPRSFGHTTPSKEIWDTLKERDDAANTIEALVEALRVANVELSALVADPDKPNFTLCTECGDAEDVGCLERAFAAIRAALKLAGAL